MEARDGERRIELTRLEGTQKRGDVFRKLFHRLLQRGFVIQDGDAEATHGIPSGKLGTVPYFPYQKARLAGGDADEVCS